jgi:hypothetical protein
VNEGFTLGVASTLFPLTQVIIFVNQLNYALGLPKMHRHEFLLENLFETLKHSNLINMTSLFLTVLFLSTQFWLLKVMPSVPPVPILTTAGIVLGRLAPSLGLDVRTLRDLFGELVLKYEYTTDFRPDM